MFCSVQTGPGDIRGVFVSTMIKKFHMLRKLCDKKLLILEEI